MLSQVRITYTCILPNASIIGLRALLTARFEQSWLDSRINFELLQQRESSLLHAALASEYIYIYTYKKYEEIEEGILDVALLFFSASY